MLNSSKKFSSKNEAPNLEKLRKEKELILREMEERKRRKAAQTFIKEKPKIYPKNENNLRNVEKSQIDEKSIKKVPKFEVKSFEQIMKEASEKEKMKKSNISDLPQISAKKSKCEVNNRAQINPPLKSINSIRKISKIDPPIPKSINSHRTKYENDERNRHKTKKSQQSLLTHAPYKIMPPMSNDKNDSHNNGDNKFNPKSVYRSNTGLGNIPRGIMAQNSSNIPSANDQKNALESKQSSFKKPSSEVSSQQRKTGIHAQSGGNKRPSSSLEERSSEENQVKKSRLSIPQNKQSNNSSQSISNKNNRGIAAQNGVSTQINRGVSAQINRGDSAQNIRGIASQNHRGVSSQNIRGIAHNSRGIAAQNSRGIAAQNSRGIAAQNSRGIAAQSGRNIPSQNSIDSMSDNDSEYDSEMDDFIDNSESYIDDNIREDIYKSLRFDPTKYKKVSSNDTCTDMLASFSVIENEEKRSRALGRKEDARELQLELESKLKKKRK